MNLLKSGYVTMPNFQHRVMLGVGTFTGMLLLVLWIAVNEPGRMDVFTQQYNGRSIENGATLFLNLCSRCHNPDGKGTGLAPALNNPMLFLRENPAKVAQTKLDDLKKQQTDLTKEIEDYNKFIAELKTANENLAKAAPGSKEEQDLKKQVEDLSGKTKNFDLARTTKQIDDLTPQIQQVQADVDKLAAAGWEPTRDVRLNEVKWTGALEDYIASTIISGRPVSAMYWTEAMPAWGQQSGGPLRPDEIRDITSYIVNFRDGAVKLTPKDVNQQFRIPGLVTVKVNESGQAVGQNPDFKALADAGLTGGDAVRGEQIYNNQPGGCGACHTAGITAPATKGTWTRLNQRLKDPANVGKTPEQFLAESIVNPNAYITPSFAGSVMPQTFGTIFDVKDIKDLIAYLETQK
jgi:mono/diheme cytochrome c family protein